jgi:hypothetical protein
VGQFVDALKTSIVNGLPFRGLCETNCEDECATLLDNLQSCLGHLILLYEVLPKAMLREPQMLFLRIFMLLNKYIRTYMLQYITVQMEMSVTCQWFHSQTDASWCQLHERHA